MKLRITKDGNTHELHREAEDLPRIAAAGYEIEVVVPVVLEGTGGTEAEARTAASLVTTDLAMARVVEDIFVALKTKGVLADADLPDEARQKMAARDGLREAVK